MLLFFVLADIKQAAKKACFVLPMCTSKAFIIRPYYPPVVLFDEVPF